MNPEKFQDGVRPTPYQLERDYLGRYWKNMSVSVMMPLPMFLVSDEGMISNAQAIYRSHDAVM